VGALQLLKPKIALVGLLLVSALTGAPSYLTLMSASAAAETKSVAETPGVISQNGMAEGDYASCVSELAAKNVVFEPLGSTTKEGCELSGAIKLQAVNTTFGDVKVSGEPTMLCSFARQFTGWVRDVGAPLTFAYTGQKLVTIETGPGLVCRTRYNKPGEKISEHAKGNAIDIAAFKLADKSRISVKQSPNDTPMSRDLISTFRATGCGYFTTILGPGSNAAHEEHLHFDYGLHGKTLNYRICE
jgi:hypothetical protein